MLPSGTGQLFNTNTDKELHMKALGILVFTVDCMVSTYFLGLATFNQQIVWHIPPPEVPIKKFVWGIIQTNLTVSLPVNSWFDVLLITNTNHSLTLDRMFSTRLKSYKYVWRWFSVFHQWFPVNQFWGNKLQMLLPCLSSAFIIVFGYLFHWMFKKHFS